MRSEALILEIWEVWSTLLLLSFSGSLSPEMVAPFRVPSMGEIELFKNYSYSIGQCEKKN